MIFIKPVASLYQLINGTVLDDLNLTLATDANCLQAKFKVTQKICQPFGFLNGGISSLIAESLSSMACLLTLKENQAPCAIDLHISHLNFIHNNAIVLATAKPVKLGSSLQFWQVEFTCNDLLCSIAKVTLKVCNLKGSNNETENRRNSN